MTKDSWDWSFASFAEQRPLDDDHAPLGAANDDEPTAARPFPGGIPVSDALERHLWTLRMATTAAERRRAAAEALRFLEETRQAAARARRQSLDEDPTIVDERLPASVAFAGLFEASSSGDASLP